MEFDNQGNREDVTVLLRQFRVDLGEQYANLHSLHTQSRSRVH